MGSSDEMSVQEQAEYLADCGNEFVVTVKQEASQKPGDNRTFLRIDDPIPLSAFNG